MKGLVSTIAIRPHIERRRIRDLIPSICRIRMFHDTFAHVLTKLIDPIRSDRIPTFVMIDPFGISGVGMGSIRALMDYPSTEVYVSFMYEFMNLFKHHPNFEPHLDDLFGCADWRRGIDMPESKSTEGLLLRTIQKATKAFRSPARS